MNTESTKGVVNEGKLFSLEQPYPQIKINEVAHGRVETPNSEQIRSAKHGCDGFTNEVKCPIDAFGDE